MQPVPSGQWRHYVKGNRACRHPEKLPKDSKIESEGVSKQRKGYDS